ncbi:MAG: acetyl-CoA carboxylase carboxyltransferase subunit alpha [Alphaproteobacteria bacterium]|nr:acetyl-CoA carboxylase carboxyltransferase subunit alpha [Alphaproteobacteria bacterium]
MTTYLDFEKPIADLEGRVEELRRLAGQGEHPVAIDEEVSRLEEKAHQLLQETYAKLTPWQKTLVARHPERPHFLDYTHALLQDFTPLAGDRAYADDKAILGGLGNFRGRPVMVIGHEKGNDTKSRLRHNFGMAMPDGYRKAIRLMTLAEKFNIPVITLVDTSGAYPGVSAEERGQAEAIARSTERCLTLSVPIVSVIIGEGGSGGAVALATADKVIMLEHAVYSVISPEGCSSILWKSAGKAQDAAAAMKITAQDLFQLRVIDSIVPEPVGGAHRARDGAMERTGDAIDLALTELDGMPSDLLRKTRWDKYLAIGRVGLA